MILDANAPSPAFAEGRLPEIDLHELIAWLRERLGSAERWSLVSARRKLGKELLEIDEAGKRIIGIISRSERTATAYQSLRTLWDAGMRPPSTYTVVQPVAHFPERNVLLIEKAEGVPLWTWIDEQREGALENVEKSAQWLVTLHGMKVDAPAWTEDQERLEKWTSQLIGTLPAEAPRIERLRDAIAREAAARSQGLAPAHGDYHPHNVFIGSGGRVTVIDLDKFSLRSPTFDVAYYLAQTACIGFWSKRSFAWTLPHRQRFLDAYQEYGGVKLAPEALAAPMAATLLQALNYDLSVFKTGRFEFAPPFLALAEACVHEGDITLLERSATLS
jgi:aminoglycoside phosphotransferase (APT) family kinase protein